MDAHMPNNVRLIGTAITTGQQVRMMRAYQRQVESVSIDGRATEHKGGHTLTLQEHFLLEVRLLLGCHRICIYSIYVCVTLPSREI